MGVNRSRKGEHVFSLLRVDGIFLSLLPNSYMFDSIVCNIGDLMKSYPKIVETAI